MELSRSYGAVMAQIWRTYRAVIVGWLVVMLSRSYGAVMAQLSRSYVCRSQDACSWCFVRLHGCVVWLSRSFRAGIVGCLCVCSRTRVARSRTRIARIRTHGVRYGLQLRVIRHCGLSEYRALIAQISRSYRRMVDRGVSLSCHGVVAQLWRSYGAVMAQVSRSSRAVIAQLWRSYGAVMAQLWRRYGAVIAQFSRSSRKILVRGVS